MSTIETIFKISDRIYNVLNQMVRENAGRRFFQNSNFLFDDDGIEYYLEYVYGHGQIQPEVIEFFAYEKGDRIETDFDPSIITG
jgi:hypothetical protein